VLTDGFEITSIVPLNEAWDAAEMSWDVINGLPALGTGAGRIRLANVVRDAIVKHVEQRRRDPEFQAHLEETMKRHARLLEMLADG